MLTGTDEPDSGGSPGDRWAGPSTGGDADEAPLSGASERFGLGGPTWQAAVTRELPVGTNLGGVTILRLLAAGGMGLVYEGRQTAPHRRVAVKVIRGGLATAATLRRFEYEAEVLARLTHPNIAQIHTFGTHTTPDGPLPFFVMELVDDARPITQHAVEERLGMRQRIAMARDVCAAVAHGHGKGVIHRDLKPGNILVDAGGTPKVIDFGVARGLDADRPPTTGAGDIVGTLRYMSPEQLAGDPGGVDARSDVHALGLVLHELVTGRLPFDGLGKPAAMAAGMLGDERLPIAATVAGAVRDAVGAADAASLGVIVEKCLKRNPADRYATAAELEAELGRWLAGEPILARRPTAIEWLARWSRRHRWAAGSAVIAAAAITAAAVGITIFGVQAERQAEEARRQLYLADVLLAAESRDRGNVGEARRLLAAARGLARRGGEPPIELACLAASLDDAIGVLDGHEGAVVGVAFRPGGRGLVTADGYGFVRVVSAAGPGETMGRTDLTFRAHEVRPWGLAISPDGRFLATASGDGTTRVWRTDDGSQVRVIEAHGKTVYGVAFSPDGRTLLTCGSDRMARLWETRTWRERQTLVGHVGTVYAGCFSPDGDVVATTSQDRTVRLWDVATGTAAGTLSGHGERVFHAAFSPDGRRLVTASEDETARIWDVASLEEVDRLRHPLRVNAAVFVGDGRRVVTASGDGLLRVWTAAATETPKVLRGHAAAISCLATAGGSVKLATGSADGTARIWDLDEPAVLRVGGRVLSAAHAPDATTLALGLDDGAIHLFDAATLRERRAIAVAAERVNGLAYSPDGESIAAACDDGTVRACNVADGECRGVFRGHARRVYSVCYSRDGAIVATAAEDRTARLWRASSAEAIGDPLVHPRRVFCAALGPDGTTVATACEDRIVRLWRVADGREIRRFAGHTAQVNWVCFAADGERIATASSDGSVRVWTVSDGRPVRILTGPARQVWKAAFSPDGSRIVGVSADGTVQIWISDSGSATPLLRGHGDEVWAVSFAPDGRSLLTGSWDGTARVWGVAPAEIARRRGGG